jgi:hypothetical protein
MASIQKNVLPLYTGDWYRQTSAQDALVDLYLLAKTRKIITDPPG